MLRGDSEPIDSSTARIPATMAVNSSGSRLTLWSLPSIPWSRVMCFSITAAPRDTAAIGTAKPRSWPEYPTGASASSASRRK